MKHIENSKEHIISVLELLARIGQNLLDRNDDVNLKDIEEFPSIYSSENVISAHGGGEPGGPGGPQ